MGFTLATAEVLPTVTEVITKVGDAFYPVILPIMGFGLGVAALWFVYRKIKAGAKGRG